MIDDQDLRERLRAVDVPPTALTTTALLDAGRRRIARRRTLRAGGGVALAAALALSLPAVVARTTGQPAGPGPRVVHCGATGLAVPSGLNDVQAEAVDPTGRYVLGNGVTRRGAAVAGKGEDVDLRPVLWTDGQPRALPLLGASVRASGVNAGGTVVAVAGRPDTSGRWTSVLRYVGGVPQRLDPPPGDWVFAATPAIDAGGDALAVAYRRGRPHSPEVLTWTAGTTTGPARLPMPAGVESLSVEVTGAGTVVGDVASPASRHTVYLWDRHGTRRELATPAGAGAYNFTARGDWVSANLTGSGTVARWDLRTGALTDTGVNAPANGVNAQGWVLAGESVQRDDATVELDSPGGLTATPVDVSDTGLVVGSVYDYGTAGPTPLPSAPGGASGAGPFIWRCGR